MACYKNDCFDIDEDSEEFRIFSTLMYHIKEQEERIKQLEENTDVLERRLVHIQGQINNINP